MDNNIAFIIQENHFKTQDVDFEQIRNNYTNNIILEYDYNNTEHFKRSLFELDRLKFNIGILFIHNNDFNNTIIDTILTDLLNNIKGFKVNLGIWIQSDDKVILKYIYDILNTNYSNNFITGVKGDSDKFIPLWKKKGDIEDNSIILTDFMPKSIKTVRINTDYKTIYEENNLSPIKSNEKLKLNIYC